MRSRSQLAFDAAELTRSCHVPSDETTTPKSLSHSVTPILLHVINVVGTGTIRNRTETAGNGTGNGERHGNERITVSFSL